ncbi:MAG: hypothetical protein ACSHWP_00200 [Pseudoalteromonas sp.]
MKGITLNKAQKKAISDMFRNLGRMLFAVGIFSLVLDDSRVYEKVIVTVIGVIIWIFGILTVQEKQTIDKLK